MRLKFLLSAIAAFVGNIMIAQVTLFTESMGTVTGNTAIATHEFNNGFDNDSFTMTSGGATSQGEIRTSSASTGYAGASAGGNVWLTTTSGQHGFAIEGIDASAYTSLNLQFGYRKESASTHATFSVDYWDGSGWVVMANTSSALFNESATAGTGWYLSKVLSLPIAAQIANLKIRFIKTGSNAIRLDDVKLIGTPLPCPATTNTITPASGPVGTEVLVTATANTLTGATATFNGISAVVTPVDATHIKVLVPTGATTGNLVTTNSSGCTASNPFTVISSVSTSCEGGGSARTQLFISEVTDHGSGSHSYIEIFNTTGATVNLNNYKLNIHNNGAATATASIVLPSYNLANNAAYVVAFGSTDAGNNYGGVTPDLISTVSGINDNDHIRLLDSGGTWIDLWGSTGATAFTVAPSDYYYRRKNAGITAPSTVWNASDWTSGTPVDYTNVGSYTFASGSVPAIVTHPSMTPTCKATSFTVAGSEGFTGGNPLAYQWYVLAPSATNWIAIANGGVYSGATSSTLGISNVTGLEGYQYYSQVRENGVSCYSASNAVMLHEPTTVTWNGTWTPSAPTVNSKVVIAASYNTLTNGSFEACSVIVNPVQTLTISPDDYVLIQTHLAVNGNLVVADSGSLIMVDDYGVVTSAGNTQILRTTKPYKKFDYTYWSSPVTAATIGSTFPTWRTDYSFSFNTANFSDVAPLDGFDDNQNDWLFAGPTATMTAGKGYIVMAPTTGTFPTTNTVNFSGVVNNGLIMVPLALSGAASNPNDDFNLIGNPYPSAVSATDFINANPAISGTLYFWSHVTAVSTSNPGPDYSNYTRDDYALFNLTGGTRASLTTPASSVPTGYIASGQGFFVEAQSAGNVLFNNAMRSKLHNNGDFFRSVNTQVQRDRIWLNLTHSDDLFSQQLIGYFAEASLDIDRGYDGIVSKTGNTVSFYSLINNDHYRIQGRPVFTDADVVPLGYSTTVAGEFTVSIDAAEGQLGGTQRVFIQDLQTGLVHDLKLAPYTFSTVAGTHDGRFLLRYTNQTLGIDEPDAVHHVVVTARSGEIGVYSTGADIVSVAMFDMLGRTVYQSAAVHSASHQIALLSMSPQAIIVKVKLESGELVTQKVLVK
ncbi:MAG TPA: lamin tail domain-containing protein [Flavobacterium sp.]